MLYREYLGIIPKQAPASKGVECRPHIAPRPLCEPYMGGVRAHFRILAAIGHPKLQTLVRASLLEPGNLAEVRGDPISWFRVLGLEFRV